MWIIWQIHDKTQKNVISAINVVERGNLWFSFLFVKNWFGILHKLLNMFWIFLRNQCSLKWIARSIATKSTPVGDKFEDILEKKEWCELSTKSLFAIVQCLCFANVDHLQLSVHLDVWVGDHLGGHHQFVPVLLICQHTSGKLDPCEGNGQELRSEEFRSKRKITCCQERGSRSRCTVGFELLQHWPRRPHSSSSRPGAKPWELLKLLIAMRSCKQA